MQKNKGHVAWLVVALLLFVMYGCSSNSESPQSGTLRVSLTDAAAGGFDAVNVTVSKVRVHQSSNADENEAGWSEITLSPARKINLLNLTNGVLENLGQTSLPAGHYTQLRLVLSANTGTTLANSVVLSGTTTTAEIPLVTPSAVQSGIKLINEFDVAAGQRVDLVLDFDALKSVVLRGNGTYALKPVIRVVPTVLTGIEGFVATSLTGSNVLVSAMSGTVTHSTVPNTQTGEFFLAHLEAGSYDVVITADGRATAVITGVPVSSATSTALVTTVSTSAEPISLPTSTMQTLSGNVALTPPPADATVTALLSSKQTVTSGLTVTVKSQPVDGAYTMSLPAGAPLLGQYGTGALPISFSEQTAAAGKYTAEASAAGYVAQSAPVDVSAGDVVQDFLLAP